jgi:hypothetical protein
MPELLQSAPTPRVRIANVRLVELAERQRGVVKRSQLEEIGLTGGGISRWIDEGRIHRIHPGVFAVGHCHLSMEARLAAALLYAGPGAALYGVTAGSWLGIIVARPTRLHIVAPQRRRSLPDVRVHHSTKHERVMHKGLPVTPPAQVLLDMARGLRPNQLRRALAEAEYLNLVTVGEVADVLGRGKPGSAALRAALERHLPALAQTRSTMEEEFTFLAERHFLAQPQLNITIAGWLVDAVWLEQRVVCAGTTSASRRGSLRPAPAQRWPRRSSAGSTRPGSRSGARRRG